jgi:hypothetical protein
MNRRYFLSSSIALGTFAAFFNAPVMGTPFLQGRNRNQANSKGIKKVNKTDAEWKRILTPDQYNVTRRKGTERVRSTRITRKAFFNASPVGCRCLARRPSLIQARAGPVSGSRSRKRMCTKRLTAACRRSALRCCVRGATPTLDTSSQMDRNLPGCATA